MKLYIMRHGEPESGMQLDPTRKLTDTGKAQAKMMGKWLKHQDDKPTLVIESNFRRSISTAKRVAKQLDAPIVRSGQLDPDALVDSTWRAIRDIADKNGTDHVIVVSHGPLVENLLAKLLGSPLPQYMTFAHAAIAHLTTTNGSRGQLHWLVTPNVVAREENKMDLVIADSTAAVEAALSIAEACAELVN